MVSGATWPQIRSYSVSQSASVRWESGVNFSRALRWCVALLIPLTLAWKIAIPYYPYHPIDPSEALIEFFQRNGFNVVVTVASGSHEPIIHATTDSCRLVIARLAPNGSNRELIRWLAGDTDRQFVVFRGDLYSQQPIISASIDYLWSRFLRELGLIRDIRPVIAVGANSACDTDRLPWGELAR